MDEGCWMSNGWLSFCLGFEPLLFVFPRASLPPASLRVRMLFICKVSMLGKGLLVSGWLICWTLSFSVGETQQFDFFQTCGNSYTELKRNEARWAPTLHHLHIGNSLGQVHSRILKVRSGISTLSSSRCGATVPMVSIFFQECGSLIGIFKLDLWE